MEIVHCPDGGSQYTLRAKVKSVQIIGPVVDVNVEFAGQPPAITNALMEFTVLGQAVVYRPEAAAPGR